MAITRYRKKSCKSRKTRKGRKSRKGIKTRRHMKKMRGGVYKPYKTLSRNEFTNLNDFISAHDGNFKRNPDAYNDMVNVDGVKSIIDNNGDTVEYNYPTDHKNTIDTTRTILEREYAYIHPSSHQFKPVTTSSHQFNPVTTSV